MARFSCPTQISPVDSWPILPIWYLIVLSRLVIIISDIKSYSLLWQIETGVLKLISFRIPNALCIEMNESEQQNLRDVYLQCSRPAKAEDLFISKDTHFWLIFRCQSHIWEFNLRKVVVNCIIHIKLYHNLLNYIWLDVV